MIMAKIKKMVSKLMPKMPKMPSGMKSKDVRPSVSKKMKAKMGMK